MYLASDKAQEMEEAEKKEANAIAYALPAHMLTLMFLECQSKGWELRMDVFDKLDKSSGVPLVGFDPLTISRLARKIDGHANYLLRELSPENPVDGLHSVAMFVLTLIDEALLGDPRAIVVIVSLLLMEDIKVGNEDWPFKERFLREQGKKLLHRANLVGLYVKRMRDAPIIIDG